MIIYYCNWWCETGTFWSFWDGGKEASEVSRPRGFPKVETPAYVVRSFGSQGWPHWGPLRFLSYLYPHSHAQCSVRKFTEEIMMPEVLVCLSNSWSSNLHDILHNHMGRNLKITFWSLSWTHPRLGWRIMSDPETRTRRKRPRACVRIPSPLVSPHSPRASFHQACQPKWWIR